MKARRLGLGKAGLLPSALTGLVCVLASGHTLAAEYYVAPNGNDANAGSMDKPFGSVQKGVDAAGPGDTVWLRAGTYQVGKQLKLNKSGTSDAMRIKYFAYQGEVPVLDFSSYKTPDSARDVEGVAITGSWLHLRGWEVKNVNMAGDGTHSNSGVRSRAASNNTFELMNIHHIMGPGLFIDGGQGGNLLLNCDSHDNYDKNGSQGDGQNGDGFGVHYQEQGPSTVIRGCRAWYNSDDGYDFIGHERPVIVESSWAMYNGLAESGTVKPSSGNGNGFKAGSSKTGVRHVLSNCVAWKNTAAGFYANHSSGGNTWYNNTSYNNGTAFNMLASPPDDTSVTITLTGDKVHVMRNNIGFPNKNANMNGVDTKSNTWDLSLTPSADDFLSTSDTGCMGPRQANGNVPSLQYLKLKEGSKLIDKGEDVKLPFEGTKPDLGAYEFGAKETNTGGGSGGSANTAGSSNMGGSGVGTSGSGNADTAGASSGGATSGGSGSDPGAGAAPTGAGSPSGAAGGTTTGNVAGSGAMPGGNGGTAPPGDTNNESSCSFAIGTGHTGTLSLLFGLALGSWWRRRRNAA